MYLAYLSISQGVFKDPSDNKNEKDISNSDEKEIFSTSARTYEKEVVEIQLSPFTYNRQVATISNFVDQQKDLKKMPWSF